MSQMINKFAALILTNKNLFQSKIAYSLFVGCIIKCMAISKNIGTIQLRLLNHENFCSSVVRQNFDSRVYNFPNTCL